MGTLEMHLFRRVGVVFALMACLWQAPASAGLFDDEEARRAILELRQRVEAVRLESEQRLASVLTEQAQKNTEENAQLRRGLIELQNQIEALRVELAKLRGQGEQFTRDLSEVQRSQKDSVQATEDRLRKLEPIKVVVDGRDFAAEPAEKRDFDAALAIFRKGDFSSAQLAFIDFLRRYPQTGYVPSALFWLGNAQYASRDYKESMANFKALLTQAPDHLRAPEAMLSIANCQVELKDVRGARKTLEDLVKSYPTSEAAAAAKERLTRLK